MSELKKCPFCGKVPKVESYNSAETLFIVTHQCGVMRHAALSIHVGYDSEMYLTRTTKKAAIAAWNRRADHSGEGNGMMPLTLDELRGIDGEPVNCKGCIYFEEDHEFDPCQGCKRLVRVNDYYRRKPEPEGGEGK